MRRRNATAALVAALASLLPVACMDERDRLTPPTLSFTADSTVPPGAQLVVRITAEDPNGIIYVSARLRCAATNELLSRVTDSGVPRDDSYTADFPLVVPDTITANTPLVIEAVTIDDQNFTTELRDTIFVRRPDVPPDQPPAPSRCTPAARS